MEDKELELDEMILGQGEGLRDEKDFLEDEGDE